MSPKISSLAFDETKEESPLIDLEPKLNLIVKAMRSSALNNEALCRDEVVNVRGRITVSF